MDLESLKVGGPGFLVVFPGSTPFQGLIAGAIGMESGLTWPLHIIRWELCPCKVCTVIQLFLLENYFVAPPPSLDPLCVVIKILEAVPMHLLIEIVQENGVPQGVLLLYKMPLGSVPLHMSSHRSGEGFSFLGGDILSYGDVV